MEPAPLITPGAVENLKRIISPLARYHRHSVEGLEHVPMHGGALLVVHHSFATYDGLLLGEQIHEHTGRLPTALGDDMLFRFPKLARWIRAAGIRPASPTAGMTLLTEGHLMFVAPGGMWEALRPTRERYAVRWASRKGFCRLALRAGVPLVLSACPAADDIYRLRASRLTDAAYHRLKVPLPIVRGLGPTVIPRPVVLTHYIAPPLVPPPHDPQREAAQVDALHAEACRIMGSLLARR